MAPARPELALASSFSGRALSYDWLELFQKGGHEAETQGNECLDATNWLLNLVIGSSPVRTKD